MIEATISVSGPDDIDCKDMTVEISVGIQPIETCEVLANVLSMLLPHYVHYLLTLPLRGWLTILEFCHYISSISGDLGFF